MNTFRGPIGTRKDKHLFGNIYITLLEVLVGSLYPVIRVQMSLEGLYDPTFFIVNLLYTKVLCFSILWGLIDYARVNN